MRETVEDLWPSATEIASGNAAETDGDLPETATGIATEIAMKTAAEIAMRTATEIVMKRRSRRRSQ